jgi:hypothetical protein
MRRVRSCCKHYLWQMMIDIKKKKKKLPFFFSPIPDYKLNVVII